MRGLPPPYNKPIRADEKAITLTVRGVGGSMSVNLTPGGFAAYQIDPDRAVAEALGVTLAQYREWVEHEGAALCGATTKKGTPCGVCLGPINMDIETWLSLHREQYCKSHGG